MAHTQPVSRFSVSTLDHDPQDRPEQLSGDPAGGDFAGIGCSRAGGKEDNSA